MAGNLLWFSNSNSGSSQALLHLDFGTAAGIVSYCLLAAVLRGAWCAEGDKYRLLHAWQSHP